ncbi:MAG: FMN reductase, partial [Halobacteria archaeon]|nr:FMN reductase [Halobacteria archaeon]
DDNVEERFVTLGRRAVRYANIEPDPATFESDQNVGADG